MSKAAELAALIGSQSALSNRNLIINGAMQVAQRGTSFATMGNGDSQYTLDRFKWQEGGSTTAEMTVTQSSTSPNEFSKSLKVDVTTADTTLGADDLIYIQYKNEGNVLGGIAKGTSDAKPLTLSFYVRSNTTGTFVVYLFDVDNTRSVSGTYTINAADTWERKEVNFPADTSGALTIDNSHAMSINWVLGAGSNLKSSTLQTSWGSYDSTALATGSTDITGSTSNDWYITGVQLEVGEQATPFEHRSFHDELRRCKRYFERFAKTLTGVGQASEANCGLWSGMSRSGNSGNNQGVMTYQTKRTNPSISVSSAAHINGVFPISPFAASLSSFGIDGNAGIDNCFVNAANNASSAPSSDCGSSGVMGNSSGTLDIDAEL